MVLTFPWSPLIVRSPILTVGNTGTSNFTGFTPNGSKIHCTNVQILLLISSDLVMYDSLLNLLSALLGKFEVLPGVCYLVVARIAVHLREFICIFLECLEVVAETDFVLSVDMRLYLYDDPLLLYDFLGGESSGFRPCHDFPSFVRSISLQLL